MSVNIVVLQGNLTRDPELKTAKETQICNFGIAVNGYKKGDVDFFDVTAFGKSAEYISSYAKKGSKILVQGRAKQDNWTNEAGEKRSKVTFIANNVQLLNNFNNQSSDNTAPNTAPTEQGATDDDVPF